MLDRIKWNLMKALKRLFLWRNPHVAIGAHTYGVPIVLFGPTEGTTLAIGKYCSIPHRRMTVILGGNHVMDWVSTYPFNEEFVEHRDQPSVLRSNGDVIVGNDVWFGNGCTILSGVTVGNGAVIGANALITRDVPPYAVVAGVPAKVIRYRFPEETILRLQALQWWDWDEQQVPAMMQGDIEQFFDRYDNRDI
jgi:acetyltransferase-like isoleucine patch superfamily enzyme